MHTIIHGDCLEELKKLEDNSVDAVITDPPYGLSNTKPQQVADVLAAWVTGDTVSVPAKRGGFMGKDWDSFVPPPAVWAECMRVLKPGGHMAVFAGARTQDLMGLSIRLAGFEIRDTLGWVYGSGFPKSMDISKAIDKRGGNAHLAKEIGKAIREARESRGLTKGWCDERFCGGTTNWSWFEGRPTGIRPPSVEAFSAIVNEWPELAPYAEKVAEVEREITQHATRGLVQGDAISFDQRSSKERERRDIPATPEAAKWSGWGTALKPAIEPIILARKPLDGTVASNVLAHGVGGLNIDACRVAGAKPDTTRGASVNASSMAGPLGGQGRITDDGKGRFPANVLLDEHAAKEMDEQSGGTRAEKPSKSGNTGRQKQGATWKRWSGKWVEIDSYSDSGGASRFFPVFKYQAKAPKKERPVIVREDGTKVQHPTVKPLKLMEWLVALITPEGGTVLDPFAGTGTTLQAATNKGFHPIGIEADTDYIQLIHKRLEGGTASTLNS